MPFDSDFICAALASRGHAVERALHLLPNTLNRPAADAEFAGNLEDAFAATQMRLDALFQARDRSELLALRHGALKTSSDTLADQAALKLGESTADTAERVGWRS